MLLIAIGQFLPVRKSLHFSMAPNSISVLPCNKATVCHFLMKTTKNKSALNPQKKVFFLKMTMTINGVCCREHTAW